METLEKKTTQYNGELPSVKCSKESTCRRKYLRRRFVVISLMLSFPYKKTNVCRAREQRKILNLSKLNFGVVDSNQNTLGHFPEGETV